MSNKKQNHRKKFKEDWREEFSHGREDFPREKDEFSHRREGFFDGREEFDHDMGESFHGFEEFNHDHHPQPEHHEHHQRHECPKCHECHKCRECQKHHECRKHHECWEHHECRKHNECREHHECHECREHHECHECREHHEHREHHQHQEHHEHMDEDKDCICSLLKRILKAQEEVEECQCKVSCERSIKQLLSPTDCPPNTVPFTLTCGCDLFCGKAAIYGKSGNFCLISSPFFKVKKVDHNCCAVLELLWPTCNGEPFKGPLNCKDNNPFPCNDFNGFIGTGACITVDLSCFCSISCQKPHMVDKASANQIQQIINGQKC